MCGLGPVHGDEVPHHPLAPHLGLVYVFVLPSLVTNDEIDMEVRTVTVITYMQHTEATMPKFRGKEWTYARGAATTVDRNFLGWMGRVFVHDAAGHHVIHHFFPQMPSCE